MVFVFFFCADVLRPSQPNGPPPHPPLFFFFFFFLGGWGGGGGGGGGGFVCVEVLRPSQPNGVMSSAVSLPNHTFTGQALSSKRLTSIVTILSPETDNCPS